MAGKDIFRNPIDANHILKGLSTDELRNLAKKDERTTKHGSAAYISVVRNRSAKFTEVVFGDPTPEQEKILKDVQEYLTWKTMIQVDRDMCINPDHVIFCRLLITEEYARIAYMWNETLFEPKNPNREPDQTIDIRSRVAGAQGPRPTRPRASPMSSGTDYLGENKKAHLRMGMYRAKKKGGLGLHAGSKIINVKTKDGKLVSKGAILFGLSGTGKTSLSCHNHGLTGDEGIVIRQDDVIFMLPDMYCVGTERNYYIKTEGLEPKGQPLLFAAATSKRAILENIWVDRDGAIDFFDYKITSNGRCVVYREDVGYHRQGHRPAQGRYHHLHHPAKRHRPARRAPEPGAGRGLLHARGIHRDVGRRPHPGGQIQARRGDKPVHRRRRGRRGKYLPEVPAK